MNISDLLFFFFPSVSQLTTLQKKLTNIFVLVLFQYHNLCIVCPEIHTKIQEDNICSVEMYKGTYPMHRFYQLQFVNYSILQLRENFLRGRRGTVLPHFADTSISTVL